MTNENEKAPGELDQGQRLALERQLEELRAQRRVEAAVRSIGFLLVTILGACLGTMLALELFRRFSR